MKETFREFYLKSRQYGKFLYRVAILLLSVSTAYLAYQNYWLSVEKQRLEEFEPVVQGFARETLVAKSTESTHTLRVSIIVVSPHNGYVIVKPTLFSYHKYALEHLDNKRLSDNKFIFKSEVRVATNKGAFQTDVMVPVGLIIFLDEVKLFEEQITTHYFPLGNATCIMEYHDVQTGKLITSEFNVTIFYIYSR